MKVKNVRKEVYSAPKNIPQGIVVSKDLEEENSITPSFGSVFNDVTIAENSAFLMGKYICGFSRYGKTISVLVEFNGEMLFYEHLEGVRSPILTSALIEPKHPFFAYDRFEDLAKTFNACSDDETPPNNDPTLKAKPKRDKKDPRIIRSSQLLDGGGAQGLVYNGFTLKDDVVGKYAMINFKGENTVIRILSNNGTTILFDVMRSKKAHAIKGLYSGFGSYTAIPEGSFNLYEHFRDAIHDFEFLEKSSDPLLTI